MKDIDKRVYVRKWEISDTEPKENEAPLPNKPNNQEKLPKKKKKKLWIKFSKNRHVWSAPYKK